MRSLKFTVALLCAYSVAIPSFAAEEKIIYKGTGVRVDNKPADAKQEEGTITVKGLTFDSKNPGDMSKIKLDKKAYMKQLEEAFDKMDPNNDGIVDAKELDANRAIPPRAEFDEDIRDVTPLSKQSMPASPVPKQPASDGSVGVPPVNAGDLLQK